MGWGKQEARGGGVSQSVNGAQSPFTRFVYAREEGRGRGLRIQIGFALVCLCSFFFRSRDDCLINVLVARVASTNFL